MKILTRYVLKEHLGPLAFAVSALTALLLLNQVAKQFGNLVGKGLGWGVIGEVFYLSIPFIVAMTLPMAVLVAVLYAFSRLAAENEVTALRASGVSVVTLVRPVLLGGLVLAGLMLLFNDQVLPRSNHRLRTLETDIARKKPTFALREQVINEVIPGKVFLKPGHIDEATNKLREVFIYNFEDPTRRKTIYADSGRMGLTQDQTTLQMTLHHGYVLQVPRDDPGTLQRLYFTTDLVRVRGVANQFEKTEKDSYKSEREMTVCEMDSQYRQGAHELQVADFDLGATLANAAHYAATGEMRHTEPPPPVQPRDRSSAALWCGLISRLGVETATAEAAAPPARPASARPVAPSAGGRAKGAGAEPEKTGARGMTPLWALPRALRDTTPKATSQPKKKQTTPARKTSPAKRGAQGTAKTKAPAHPPARPHAVAPPASSAQPRALPQIGRRTPTPSEVAQRELARQDSILRRDSATGRGAKGKKQTPSVLLAPQMHAGVPPNPVRLAALPSAGQLDVYKARIADARMTMARYEVEIQKKFALAAACVVFVIFGAPIALRFPRGGVGLVIGVSLVAFALYYVCLIAGETLADKLILSPFWAMWAANVLFAVVGILMLARVQRSGATARGGDASEIWDAVRARSARWLRRVGIHADRRRTA